MGRDETANLASALTQEELITTLAYQLFPDNSSRQASLIHLLRAFLIKVVLVLDGGGFGLLTFRIKDWKLVSAAHEITTNY